MALVGLLRFEVIVYIELAAVRESVLEAVVLVTKVMTVAGRNKGESERIIRRIGAAIRRPVKSRGVLSITASNKVGESYAKEKLICDGCEAALASSQRSIRGWQCQSRWGKSGKKGCKLHYDKIVSLALTETVSIVIRIGTQTTVSGPKERTTTVYIRGAVPRTSKSFVMPIPILPAAAPSVSERIHWLKIGVEHMPRDKGPGGFLLIH